jgi:tight adherence protein B
VLAAMLTVSSPDYMASLTKDPTGHRLIAGAFGLVLVGILWIRRVIRIDV